MKDDARRWDDKFRNGSHNPPAPDALLRRYQGHFPAEGVTVDLAAGRCANAIELARMGYHSIALDVSHVGLTTGRSLGMENGVVIHCAVVDLDHYLLPANHFAVVSVTRFLRRELFPQLAASLAPRGVLVYRTFNRNHLLAHPRFNPDYVVDAEELRNAFGELEIIAASDSAANTETTSWVVARRPG